MSIDISGFGVGVHIVASSTFPQGFQVSQFADDSDPIDIPSIEIAGTAMGLNGDLITWTTAVPVPVNISTIPSSDDDINLSILASGNQAGRNKRPARDTITLVVVYPDETRAVYTNGVLTSAPPGKSIASSGRQKTNTYNFMFENNS